MKRPVRIVTSTSVPAASGTMADVPPSRPREPERSDPASPADAADRHYARHVAPLVAVFETKRQAALKAFWQRVPLVCGGGAALIGLMLWLVLSQNLSWGVFAVTVFIAGGGGWWYATRPLEAYKDDVRTDIFPRIVSYFGDDFRYTRECAWTIDRVKNSELIESHDDETLEDHIQGTYRGVGIEVVEAKLTREVSSGKNKRTVVVFDGLLFLLTPKKAFSGKIVVKRDAGMAVNAIAGFFSSRFGDLKPVRLEDPTFENRFEVYATDQVEARRILTTSFMQRLLDLGAAIGNTKVDCSFFDDVLLIRAPTTHDYFEPSSVFKPVDFREDFDRVITEMTIVFQIIDTLRLDLDIGL